MLKLDRTHQLKKSNGFSLMEATRALTGFGKEAEARMECVTHDFPQSYQAVGPDCQLVKCHWWRSSRSLFPQQCGNSTEMERLREAGQTQIYLLQNPQLWDWPTLTVVRSLSTKGCDERHITKTMCRVCICLDKGSSLREGHVVTHLEIGLGAQGRHCLGCN